MKRKLWNKCDVCGRIIPYADFESGASSHVMLTPDSEVSEETWRVRCKLHNKETEKESKQ